MYSTFLFRLIICLFSIKSFSTENYEESYESVKYDSIGKCEDRQLPHKKIVCFYRVEDEFRPYDIDPCLCTHLIYSYVAVRENFAFIAGKKGDLKFLTTLKQQNPGLKVLVSLRPSNNQFILQESERSNTTSSAVRTKFAKRVREFIRRHGLDGVDLDWEYFKEAHNHITKRETLLSVLNILSNELKPFNETSEDIHSLLTITASKYARDLTDYYDFSEIYRLVDFVNVPAFNFDANPKTISHPSRLHGLTDMENMDSVIDLVLALGLPQEQLVVGVPAHGTLYKLLNISQTEPGSPATAWNNDEVIISHSKICAVRDNTNWTLVRDKDLTAPYLYSREKWIGFDDEISIKLKAKYVALRQLSGLAIWNLNDDDYSGKCGFGPFPLLQNIRRVFLKPTENINNNKSYDSYFPINEFNENSFVAVIEKYGNVERITESDENELSCSHSGYIRHPNDCTKFYRCVQFNRNDENQEIFQYNCPIGLVFDDRYEMCNWPSWSPPCLGSGEIVVSPKRRFNCQSYGYFQDPENCEYFFYCSNFGKQYLQPYQMKCPFDLAFDEEKLVCNWKWLVNGCGPVDPADQIIRDLPQLLNQNQNSEPQLLAEASNDHFMERSDYIDVDPNQSLNSDQSNQSPNSNTDQKEGSKFKKITQYMTKLVGEIGSRLKSIFKTKVESRSDKQGNRWLSRVNNYMPVFNKKRPNSEPNHNTNKHRMPYISDPLISIPILEIRPDSHLRNSHNRGKTHPKQKIQMNSISKHNRNPGNAHPLHGLNDDMFKISSITKTVQKLQEIIPMKNTKTRNRGKDNSREPIAMSSNIRVTKVPYSSSTPSVKPSQRPQKNSGLKNKIRSKLHFPNLEPLMIETLEDLELPHYMPNQMSNSNTKNSNPRPQHQRYFGTIVPQKEILHFKPEELNLDKIKTETKLTQISSEQTKNEDKKSKQNYIKNNNNLNAFEINFHNIDPKLMNSFQYSLTESDTKNDFQTIHLANNPNKEIKVNVNKVLNPSLVSKQNTGEGVQHKTHNFQQNKHSLAQELFSLPSDTIKVPDLSKFQSLLSDSQIPFAKNFLQKPIENYRIPDFANIFTNNGQRDHTLENVGNKHKNSDRLPFNAFNFGHSVQFFDHYLPNTEEVIKKHIQKASVLQIKPETVSKPSQLQNQQQYHQQQQSKQPQLQRQPENQHQLQQKQPQHQHQNQQQKPLQEQRPQETQQQHHQQHPQHQQSQQQSQHQNQQQPQHQNQQQPQHQNQQQPQHQNQQQPQHQNQQKPQPQNHQHHHQQSQQQSQHQNQQQPQHQNQQQPQHQNQQQPQHQNQQQPQHQNQQKPQPQNHQHHQHQSQQQSQHQIQQQHQHQQQEKQPQEQRHPESQRQQHQQLQQQKQSQVQRQPENSRNQQKSKPIETKPHSIVWPQVSDIDLEPQPFLPLPNIPEFDSKKIAINRPKDNKPSNQIPNQQNFGLDSNNAVPKRNNNIRQKERTENKINKNIVNNPYSETNIKQNVDHLDASASINEHYASYQSMKQKPISDKSNSNRISSTQDIRTKNKNKSSETYSHKVPEKSQLLIVPISDDFSDANKYTNFEKLHKEYPKLFPEDMIIDNKNAAHSEPKTTSRPRVIFTAPSTLSTLGPSVEDEYIMLMLNNEQNILNNTDRQKSIHEIFKKTDGKLYNLETESSRTLVALVPKTPTTPKPVLYEAIPNMVSFNVTQPPVVIKFEIPRPKSEVFQSIVQKVRDEWLPPYVELPQTLPPYQVYKNPYNQRTESTTARPYIPVTYETTTTTTQHQFDFQNLPSIYDSLQQILAQSHFSFAQPSSTPSYQPTETTTAPTTTTTQSSVILEHIPIYGGYNTNNRTTAPINPYPQNLIPWYQQVVSYPAPVNPYPAMHTYPQMAANYPYYPMQSGYGYRAPANIPPPNSFQPQFLAPNMTSNNWYDFYGNDPNQQTTEPTTTEPTTTTTTSTTTTTPSTTTESVITSSATTQRNLPRVRSRPSFSRRPSTTKKPKTTTEEMKIEVTSEDTYDMPRVDNREPIHKNTDNSEEPEVKIVYVDEYKQTDNKQTHHSDVTPKEVTKERYGFRTGVKPTNKESHQNERFEYSMDSEPYNREPLPSSTESYPKFEAPVKDIEYDDEPEVSSIAYEEYRSTSRPFSTTTKSQNIQNSYNRNQYPGIRNITESGLPESACTRSGLFQHPYDCNKYYECYWDKYINKFTIHSFECPVKLAFDSRIIGCGLPNDPTICVQY